MEEKTLAAFSRLSDILDTLRKECPWDRVQTIESLRYLTIEEVYELSDAILKMKDSKDGVAASEFKKELGDLFMHLMFYAKIAEDHHYFSLAEVLDGICDKLVQRHPKIYPPKEDASKDETWEQIKMHEGRKSVLEGVPEGLPSLVKSVRMQEKVSGMGFDYATAEDAFEKVREEYAEFCDAPCEEEFGDLLFALVKWGSKHGINADDALSRTNIKFQKRFQYIEQKASEQGKNVSQLSKEEMMTLWDEAKVQK